MMIIMRSDISKNQLCYSTMCYTKAMVAIKRAVSRFVVIGNLRLPITL
jgi:hypothetical protein